MEVTCRVKRRSPFMRRRPVLKCFWRESSVGSMRYDAKIKIAPWRGLSHVEAGEKGDLSRILTLMKCNNVLRSVQPILLPLKSRKCNQLASRASHDARQTLMCKNKTVDEGNKFFFCFVKSI